MEVVSGVLNEIQRNKSEALKSIVVSKLIEPDLFPEDLLTIDTNELNYKEMHVDQEKYTLNYTRDCVQYMVSKLSSFAKEPKDGIMFTKCTGLTFSLPREKPIPIQKPLTKWQKFAKEKGIKKKKKPRVTWDDILQKWVPTYGYKKVAAQNEKEWLLEVPKNIDPNTDMFAEKKKIKKENIAKNEYQRLRNIAAGRKIKVPDFGVPPLEGAMHPSQLKMAATLAKSSTASLGKFQPNLPGEKADGKPKTLVKKPKHSFKSIAEEKKTQQAIHKQLQEERTREPARKSVEDDKNKAKKKSKKRKGKHSFKKPKSEKGKSSGKKNNSGRKRR